MCTADNRRLSREADLLKSTAKNKAAAAVRSVLAGVFCGGLALGASVVTGLFGFDAQSASSVCFTSLILIQLAGCFELMRWNTGFFDGMTNVYIISTIITVEYLTLSAVFPTFFAKYLTGTAYISGIFICLIPLTLFILVCALIRASSRGKKRGREENE